MIPEPLHPAIVHFPIVLMMLLPLVAVAGLAAIRRGVGARMAWSVAAVVAVLLAASAWTSVQTGSLSEEAVEDVVPRAALHQHEENGELFMSLAIITGVVALAGLAPGRLGAASRVVATLAACGLVVAGWQVGHSGGELVYKYDAPSAYAQPSGVGAAGQDGSERDGERGESEEEGEGAGLLGALRGAIGGGD